MPRRPSGLLAVAVTAAALSWHACASVPVRLPQGPWAPEPGGLQAFDEAAASCLGARTLTAEIAVSGRAAGTKLRGRVIVGFARPGRVRIEGLAPFGAPAFILAGRGDRATLLLPRDRRVLSGAAVDEVLEALTGIRRSADDLAALLTGCVVSQPAPGAVTRNGAGWLAVWLRPGTEAFLARDGGPWRIVAGRHAPAGPGGPSWSVQYREFPSAFPSAIRLYEQPAGSDASGGEVDLTLRVSQREVNVEIADAAFDVKVPGDATPLSLEDVRQAGPLADAGKGRAP